MQAFLNNPNIDHRGFFLTASPCRISGVLEAFLGEVSGYLFILTVKQVHLLLLQRNCYEGLNCILFSVNRRC